MEFLRIGDPRLVANLRREGVALVAALLTEEQVAETVEALARYQREVLPSVPPAYRHYFSDGTLRSMLDLDRYDPWFHELATRIGRQMTDLVEWTPVVQYVESFPKPPGSGAVGAHQELQTNPVDPPNFVHLWIALADTTPNNGGMSFYRGTHRLGLAPHAQPDEHIGAPTVDRRLLNRMASLRIQPVFRAGNAAVFDCLTIHSSDPNQSGHARPALTIAYRDAQAMLPDESANIESIIRRLLRECGLADDVALAQSASVDDANLLWLGADLGTAAGIRAYLVREYGVDLPSAADLLRSTPQALAAMTAAARDSDVAVIAALAPPRCRAPFADPDRARLYRLAVGHRAPAAGSAPLTATQEGIWLAELLDPGAAGYHDTIALRVTGQLSGDRLWASLERLLTRHEALRCRVADTDDGPAQVFDVARLDYAERDLRSLPAQRAGDLADRLAALAATEAFDLAAGPLWRARLVRLPAGEHLLVMVFHHLVTDGWSHRVVLRDLLQGYLGRPDAGRAGGTSYARWLSDRVALERAAAEGAAADVVAARLRALPRRVPLPGCGPAGDRRAVALPVPVAAATWTGFLRVCAGRGVTGFMGTTGVLASVLGRRAGLEALVVASPLARRAEPEVVELVGCLVDLLPVRVRAAPDARSPESIDAGRRGWLEALPDADVPYREIARRLHLLGAHEEDPVTNVAVQQLNVSLAVQRVGDLLVQPLPRRHLAVRHDLTFSVPAAGDGRLELLYPEQRWAAEQVRDIAEDVADAITTVVGGVAR